MSTFVELSLSTYLCRLSCAPIPFPIPFPIPIPLPLPRPPTLRFRDQKLLQEAATTRQSTPVQERSIAWNRLKEETDLKRIVSGARKW